MSRSSPPRSRRRCVRAALIASVLATSCGRIGYDSASEDAAPQVDAQPQADAAPGAPDASPGAPDAAPPDATPPLLACDDPILCDGFDGDVSGWSTRGAADPGTSFDLVAAPVIDGTRALRFSADVDNGVLWMLEHRFSAITAGTIHGRAMVWVDAATTFEDFLVVLQLDNGDDTGDEKVSIDLLPDDRIALTATTANPGAQPTSAASAIDRDTWMCLRFEVAVADSGGRIRLTRDGTLVASATGIDTRPTPSGFIRLMIGLAAATQLSGSVVFDAVALAGQPLPCP